jgi:glycosyltransferase involved in cell wall biosynthesis
VEASSVLLILIIFVDLVEEALTDKQWFNVYARCNAFVSLHHSEWEGLKILKAIALQKPTIATDFGANTDYFSIQAVATAHYPIPYSIQAAVDYSKAGPKAALLRSGWAIPNEDDAVRSMTKAFERRSSSEHMKMLEKASKSVRESFSATTAGKKMSERLHEVDFLSKQRVVVGGERTEYQGYLDIVKASLS